MTPTTHLLRIGLLALAASTTALAQGPAPADPTTPVDPRAQPESSLGVSGGAIAPGSVGTNGGAASAAHAASAPPRRPGVVDARPGDTTNGGARRGASPINAPMDDPAGRTRRPGATGLEPGAATQRLPGVSGSGAPATDANGGAGTIGQPSNGAGSLNLRPKGGASGAAP